MPPATHSISDFIFSVEMVTGVDAAGRSAWHAQRARSAALLDKKEVNLQCWAGSVAVLDQPLGWLSIDIPKSVSDAAKLDGMRTEDDDGPDRHSKGMKI